MSNLKKLYQNYGKYNILYDQLNLTSPSVEYSLRRTRLLLFQEANRIIKLLIDSGCKNIAVGDIGCGNGALIFRLAHFWQHTPVVFFGYDISLPFINYCQQAVEYKKLKNINFFVFDVEKENIPQNFNLIISSEVFEHLKNPISFLKNVNNALFPSGYFLLTTPNSNNWIKYPFLFIKKIIIRSNTNEFKQSLSRQEQVFKLAEDQQHINVYSYSRLNMSLHQVGLVPYQTPRSTSVFGGAFFDNHNLLFALLLVLDSLFNLVNIPFFGWDNIFFCQKK